MPSISSILRSLTFSALLSFMISTPTSAQVACTSEINILPKYGKLRKCQALVDADERFLATIDQESSGDRRKAAEVFASLGWQYYREEKSDYAMRRFNQAWLLDKNNGAALWGMGAIESNREKHNEAALLFLEAEHFFVGNLNFQWDYARAMSAAGIALKDTNLSELALEKFKSIYNERPNDAGNLQAWAMTLYALGRYEQAWEKIQIGLATPEASVLSRDFIDSLRQRVGAEK